MNKTGRERRVPCRRASRRNRYNAMKLVPRCSA